MKDYIKKQYSGNENGWGKPVKDVSTHRISEAQAEELNKHFGSTGTKYVEAPVAESPDAETENEHIEEHAEETKLDAASESSAGAETKSADEPAA